MKDLFLIVGVLAALASANVHSRAGRVVSEKHEKEVEPVEQPAVANETETPLENTVECSDLESLFPADRSVEFSYLTDSDYGRLAIISCPSEGYAHELYTTSHAEGMPFAVAAGFNVQHVVLCDSTGRWVSARTIVDTEDNTVTHAACIYKAPTELLFEPYNYEEEDVEFVHDDSDHVGDDEEEEEKDSDSSEEVGTTKTPKSSKSDDSNDEDKLDEEDATNAPSTTESFKV